MSLGVLCRTPTRFRPLMTFRDTKEGSESGAYRYVLKPTTKARDGDRKKNEEAVSFVTDQDTNATKKKKTRIQTHTSSHRSIELRRGEEHQRRVRTKKLQVINNRWYSLSESLSGAAGVGVRKIHSGKEMSYVRARGEDAEEG